MTVLGFDERRLFDATACDMNTHILDILLLLLLLLLVSATSLPLRLPIIHGSVPILVILAVVQNEYFLVKPDVVAVLLRDHIVLVDNLLLGRCLLLPALLGLKQFRFLALKLAPLLAQLLNVGGKLVEALRDHDCLSLQVGELAGVQLALFAELRKAWLDFVQALVLLDLELVFSPDAASGTIVV